MIKEILLLLLLPLTIFSCTESGGSVRCYRRWNGIAAHVKALVIYQWDGVCHFPDEADRITLYGIGLGCEQCLFPVSGWNEVTVNGRLCKVSD
jgi:hypothetical protein